MTDKIKSEDFIKAFGSGVSAKVEKIPMKTEIVAGKCPIEAGGNCPLRPQGKWIYERPNGKTYSDFVFCSVCHKHGGFYKTNFCPECGARMVKGGENE